MDEEPIVAEALKMKILPEESPRCRVSKVVLNASKEDVV